MNRKKLAFLLLSMVMLLSTFSLFSCGEDEVDVDTSGFADDDTRIPVSLNFYIITDERTTDEAKQRMQDAFNAVSETKYRTRVEFTFYTEDEYAEKMEEHFELIENGTVTYPGEIDSSKTKTEYYYDDLGQRVPKYPEIQEGQIDIVLVTGKDMLLDYVEKGRVKALNEMLDSEFKAVRSYINTDLYNSVALDGQWYSIPNNKVLGNYTYLMVNKEVAARGYFNEEDFLIKYGNATNYQRVACDYNNVLELVKFVASENAKKLANPDDATNPHTLMTPLYSAFDFPTAEFWMEDGSDSVFATFYDSNTKLGDLVRIVNPFLIDESDDDYVAAQSYVNYLRLMVANRENSYDESPNGNTDLPFAVAVMEGDRTLRHQYEDDYMVLTLDIPRLEEQDMFASMLSVSNYTRHSERSLEIISALTMDPELRNILLYGEEGTDFITYTENGVTMAQRLSDDYVMSIEHTGNAFIAYPCEQDGQTSSVWVDGMRQNNEAFRSPTYGFDAKALWNNVETALADNLTALFFRPLVLKTPAEEAKIHYLLGTVEDYTEYLAESLYQSIYAEYEGKVLDQDLQDSIDELIARMVASMLDEVKVEATATAEGFFNEARELSDQYIAMLQDSVTLEEFENNLADIRQDMKSSPVFSCNDSVKGTPFNLYEIGLMEYVDYTFRGALHIWWQTISGQ